MNSLLEWSRPQSPECSARLLGEVVILARRVGLLVAINGPSQYSKRQQRWAETMLGLTAGRKSNNGRQYHPS